MSFEKYLDQFAVVSRLSRHQIMSKAKSLEGQHSEDFGKGYDNVYEAVNVNVVGALPEHYSKAVAEAEVFSASCSNVESNTQYKNLLPALAALITACGSSNRLKAQVMQAYAERMGRMEPLIKEFWSGIRSVLSYGGAVMVTGIVCLGILMTKVLPQFAYTFDSFGSELPAFTLFVLGASEYAYVFFIVCCLFVGALFYFSKTIKNRIYRLEPMPGFIKSVPPLKQLYDAYSYFLLLQYLEVMQVANGSALNAMNLAKDTAKFSKPTNRELVLLHDALCAADTLKVLEQELPYQNSVMMEVLSDQVMRVRQTTTALIASILGVFVGGMVVAMYLPIFALGGTVN